MVEDIEIYKINDFPNHPFKVKDDEHMNTLIKSIREYGVLVPVIVRQKDDGGYEMISGHRRKKACELLGIKKIRCIVKELTDDEATILMIDSNIQREEILPSEKAFSYKMKLEALKHQGRKIDFYLQETFRQDDRKFESAEIIGKKVGKSARTIQRYIRLTYLIPELLELVDSKRIAFGPAVELSYLSEENQYIVENIFEFDEVTPSLSQAIKLKKLEQEGKLTEEKIEEILQEKKPNQKEFLKIHSEKIAYEIDKLLKENATNYDIIKFLTEYDFENLEDIKDEIDDLVSEYKNKFILEVRETLVKDYESAKKMAEEMQDILPDDNDINDLVDEIIDLEPVSLLSLEAEEKEGRLNISQNPRNDIKDLDGNSYTNYISVTSTSKDSNTVTYKLDNQYSKLTGKICVMDSSKDATVSGETRVNIYSNGNLLYTSDIITNTTKSLDFSVDVDNVNDLKIELIGGTNLNYFIADPILSKK